MGPMWPKVKFENTGRGCSENKLLSRISGHRKDEVNNEIEEIT
jgi:hypothetical protein